MSAVDRRGAARVRLVSSLLFLGCYLSFTSIAYARFPGPYSPLRNWLSDLGSSTLNPTGAGFYNLGVAAGGLLLLAFFLGFSGVRVRARKVQSIVTYLSVAFGCAGAAGMLMSAIHPIDQPAIHSRWCLLLFTGVGTAFAFSIAALRYHPAVPRWLLGFGAAAVLVNFGVQVFFNAVPLSEWIDVPLLVGYCALVGTCTRKVGMTRVARLSPEPLG